MPVAEKMPVDCPLFEMADFPGRIRSRYFAGRGDSRLAKVEPLRKSVKKFHGVSSYKSYIAFLMET